MKKILSIALMAGLFSAALFAEDYVVNKTFGKVNYETSNGVWKELKAGDKITSETVINVALHSSIDLKADDGKIYTVKAMKKGAVDSLIVKGNGLKKASTSVAGRVGADEGTSSSVSTASSRAAEAKEDLNWDE